MQTVGIAGSRNVVQKYRCALICLLLHRGHMWFQSDQDGRRDEIFFYEGAARIRRDLHIPLVVMKPLTEKILRSEHHATLRVGLTDDSVGSHHTTKRLEGWNRLRIRTGSMRC